MSCGGGVRTRPQNSSPEGEKGSAHSADDFGLVTDEQLGADTLLDGSYHAGGKPKLTVRDPLWLAGLLTLFALFLYLQGIIS